MHVSTTWSCTGSFHYFLQCLAPLCAGHVPTRAGPPTWCSFAQSSAWPVAGTTQTFMNEPMSVADRKGRGREFFPKTGKNERMLGVWASHADSGNARQNLIRVFIQGQCCRCIGKETPHLLPKYHCLGFMPRKLPEMHASKNSVH